MSNPVVSVILPTLNRAELLPMSAGSVLAQSFSDLELIVVDDGSKEDIKAVVESINDDRLRYVRREQCGGPAAARNSGLAIARGKYVAFQDSDDEWLLEKLERQIEVVADSGGAMCICGIARGLSNGIRSHMPTTTNYGKIGFDEISVAARPYAYTQTWLVPRLALTTVGGFDERLLVWEDWELLLRLARQVEIRALSKLLVISSPGEDSISSRNSVEFLRSTGIILDKHVEVLRRYPRQEANMHYIRARLCINTGKLGEAQKILLSIMLRRPGFHRAWALFVASLFGQVFLRRVIRWASDKAKG